MIQKFKPLKPIFNQDRTEFGRDVIRLHASECIVGLSFAYNDEHFFDPQILGRIISGVYCGKKRIQISPSCLECKCRSAHFDFRSACLRNVKRSHCPTHRSRWLIYIDGQAPVEEVIVASGPREASTIYNTFCMACHTIRCRRRSKSRRCRCMGTTHCPRSSHAQ